MTTDLHRRLMLLAHQLRDSDPEAMAWIMRHVHEDHASRVRRPRPIRATVAGHKKAGEFVLTPERLEELRDGH